MVLWVRKELQGEPKKARVLATEAYAESPGRGGAQKEERETLERGSAVAMTGYVVVYTAMSTPSIKRIGSHIGHLRRKVHCDICIERGQRLVGAAALSPRTFVRREVEREEGAKLGGRFGRAGEGVCELGWGAKAF